MVDIENPPFASQNQISIKILLYAFSKIKSIFEKYELIEA